MDNAIQQEALEIVKEGHNVYIGGQAGCGKSFVVQEIFRWATALEKNVWLTCTTGIACSVFPNSKFNEETLQDIAETFSLFDNKGDGKIAASQVGDCLRALGQNPCESQIRKCGFQGNPEGRISLEVFLPILQTISRDKETHRAEDFIEGFRVFDKEQNGSMMAAEMRHILSCLGDKLTDEECDQLFQGQEDSQGMINYEEFVKNVMQG